jgi:hypothetical protein
MTLPPLPAGVVTPRPAAITPGAGTGTVDRAPASIAPNLGPGGAINQGMPSHSIAPNLGPGGAVNQGMPNRSIAPNLGPGGAIHQGMPGAMTHVRDAPDVRAPVAGRSPEIMEDLRRQSGGRGSAYTGGPTGAGVGTAVGGGVGGANIPKFPNPFAGDLAGTAPAPESGAAGVHFSGGAPQAGRLNAANPQATATPPPGFNPAGGSGIPSGSGTFPSGGSPLLAGALAAARSLTPVRGFGAKEE